MRTLEGPWISMLVSQRLRRTFLTSTLAQGPTLSFSTILRTSLSAFRVYALFHLSLCHEFSQLPPSFKSIYPSFPTALSYFLPSHHCTGIVGRHPGTRDRVTEDLEAACAKHLAEAAAFSTVNATSGEFASGIPPLNTLKNPPRGRIWKWSLPCICVQTT